MEKTQKNNANVSGNVCIIGIFITYLQLISLMLQNGIERDDIEEIYIS